MDLPLQTCVEKAVYGVETRRLFGKEKVLAASVIKEGDADSPRWNERTHYDGFPW